jgi:EAL domain-containing protein (putative c-di-GMP-specific phosphodiesterase class I)
MATRVASRIHEAMREPFALESMSLRVDASIGIAIAPGHGAVPETLLQKADSAMYAAKRDRLPWQIYSTAHEQNTREGLQLMEDLRDAIEREQIVLYYQPKFDLSSGTVTGVEALARWRHPQHGILEPARFLKLVEDGGLMGPFTMAVLDQALIQQSRWAESGYDLGVAVNLSAVNLRDEDLPGKVAALIAKRGVSPARITLEITEDCFIANLEQGLRVLNQLRALGVEISIDDYGTGFSSLTYLRRLPVSELKLDRTFLTGVPHDSRAVSVIRSTVDLAHALGLRIVVEGVEDIDALALIAELGCDVAQGYLLGRPVPADQVLVTRPNQRFYAVNAGTPVSPLAALQFRLLVSASA